MWRRFRANGRVATSQIDHVLASTNFAAIIIKAVIVKLINMGSKLFEKFSLNEVAVVQLESENNYKCDFREN